MEESEQDTRELLLLWLGFLRKAMRANDALAEEAAKQSLLVLLRDGFDVSLTREVRAQGERWTFFAPWGSGIADSQSDALLRAGDAAVWRPIGASPFL